MRPSQVTPRPLLLFALLTCGCWSLLPAAPALHAQISVTAPPHNTHTYTVAIEKFQFHPATLTVNAGDVITWKNSDIYPHTVTDSHGTFDSKSIAANATWTYTPTKPGTYHYICSLHPNMHATLIVH